MSYTTISSWPLNQSWPTAYGASGTLGIFCNQNFVADDGKQYLAGAGDSLTGEFVTKANITISGGVATVASFSLPKTDLATPQNVPRYTARIFDANGSPRDDWPFQNFHLKSVLGDSISYLYWYGNNQTPIIPPPDGAPTVPQMNVAIAAAINAPATTTQNGTGEVSVSPADSAHPIFVGDNDPRVPTQNENDALVGTSGAPSSSNKYVTNADSRVNTVYDVKSYGAVGDGITNDRAAIQAAINANEAAGGYGRIVIPPGTYLVQTTSASAQVLLVKKAVEIDGLGGSVIKFSVTGGVNTTNCLSVVPPSTSPSYNTLDHFRLTSCRLLVDGANKPGGFGLLFDTSGSLAQIRNAVVEHVQIGSPTAEQGLHAIGFINNPGNTDGIFDVQVNNSWLYGAVYFYYAGDNIVFNDTQIPSNTVDRDVDVLMTSGFGAEGPYFRGGQITCGGGVRLRAALGATFEDVNIEVANPALSTIATRAALDVKGDVGLVEATTIAHCKFITNGVAIDGIYIGANTRHTLIGANNSYYVGAGQYLWNNGGGAASGVTVEAPQHVRAGSPSSAVANGFADLEYSFAPLLWQNQKNLQNGIFDITGPLYVEATSPQIIVNTTSTSTSAALFFEENGSVKPVIQYVGSAHATTARRSDLELVGASGGGIAFWTNNGSGNVLQAKFLPTGLLSQGEGAVLSVASNTIAPTNQIHHVGAGLIKTITVPTNFASGSIFLIPDAAFTYDTTGNIAAGGGGTATIGRVMTATYSSSSGKWFMSY